LYNLKRIDGLSVLVTGGCGFVGTNLCLKLKDLGANIIALDALLPDYGATKANVEELKQKGVIIEVVDVRDFDKMCEVIKKYKPDIVYHGAAQVSHLKSMQVPEGAYLDIDINLKGTINVLEAARRYDDNAKLIYIGTRGEYGDPQYLPIDENHPETPPDIYGVDKLAAGRYFLVYARAYGMWVSLARPTNLIGPRQRLLGFYGIIGWFVRLALEDKTIIIFGDGMQTRDVLYIDDAVDALILMGQNDIAKNKIYNIASGKEYPLRYFAELIVKHAGKGRIEFKPYPPEWKRIEIRRVVLSYDKIKKDLGWEPRTSIEDAIRKTVEFYKQNLSKYL